MTAYILLFVINLAEIRSNNIHTVQIDIDCVRNANI